MSLSYWQQALIFVLVLPAVGASVGIAVRMAARRRR